VLAPQQVKEVVARSFNDDLVSMEVAMAAPLSMALASPCSIRDGLGWPMQKQPCSRVPLASTFVGSLLMHGRGPRLSRSLVVQTGFILCMRTQSWVKTLPPGTTPWRSRRLAGVGVEQQQ
jgi:hypothetical protein